MTPPMPEAVAISVSTLHRAAGLERVLRSLAAQAGPSLPRIVAVVVNNDPTDAGPRATVERVRGETGLAIELLDEPRRGVAPPRNRGLARARELAPVVGFLDERRHNLARRRAAPAGDLVQTVARLGGHADRCRPHVDI